MLLPVERVPPAPLLFLALAYAALQFEVGERALPRGAQLALHGLRQTIKGRHFLDVGPGISPVRDPFVQVPYQPLGRGWGRRKAPPAASPH